MWPQRLTIWDKVFFFDYTFHSKRKEKQKANKIQRIPALFLYKFYITLSCIFIYGTVSACIFYMLSFVPLQIRVSIEFQLAFPFLWTHIQNTHRIQHIAWIKMKKMKSERVYTYLMGNQRVPRSSVIIIYFLPSLAFLVVSLRAFRNHISEANVCTLFTSENSRYLRFFFSFPLKMLYFQLFKEELYGIKSSNKTSQSVFVHFFVSYLYHTL